MKKSSVDPSKVTSASLIDLKAELFRKQEEFKNQKLQNESTGFIRGKPSTSVKKPTLFSKKNTGVSERAEKDYEEKVEEENVFERSRKALESKAKLYEKISSGAGISEEDGSGLFLVDFQKKNLDEFEHRLEQEKREREDREKKEIEEEQRQLAEPVPPPDSEEDEWVDYVDAFGRSRRCLKKDLPDLKRQDSGLQEKKRKLDEKAERGYKDFQDLRDKSSEPSLLSSDMRRELDRQKWEEEERQKMETEKQGPIHYADVQHNEVRSHGVGFYKFDKEESVRQQQMDQLNTLRQQTKDERSKSERIKEKRKAALAARLAKVKQRKREKLGLPDLEEEDTKSSDEEIGPQLSEQAKPEPEPLTRDDNWRATTKSTREWDIGKHVSAERSEQSWLEKQRAERDNEFAPPTFYYENTPTSKYGTGKEKDLQTKQATYFAGKKDTNIQSIVEQQLIKIRETSETIGTSEIECGDNIQKDTTQSSLAGQHGKEAPSKCSLTTLTSTTVQSEHVMSDQVIPKQEYFLTSCSAPVPNVSIPPPNFSIPPPTSGYTLPPTMSGFPMPNISFPDMTLPPPPLNVQAPNFNAPPPNFTMPPPFFPPNKMDIPAQSFNISNHPMHDQTLSPSTVPSSPALYMYSGLVTSPGTVNAVTYTDHVTGQTYSSSMGTQSSIAVTSVDNINQSSQQITETSETRKKFVPKFDIVDTRLMEGE